MITTKAYYFHGKKWLVDRDEQWYNDETQVEFYVNLGAGKNANVGSGEFSWPDPFEVLRTLVDSGKIEPTPAEQLGMQVFLTEKQLLWAQHDRDYCTACRKRAEKELPSAVERAQKELADAAEKERQAIAKTEAIEIRLHDLKLELSNHA